MKTRKDITDSEALTLLQEYSKEANIFNESPIINVCKDLITITEQNKALIVTINRMEEDERNAREARLKMELEAD